jgi:hypothetical protein
MSLQHAKTLVGTEKKALVRLCISRGSYTKKRRISTGYYYSKSSHGSKYSRSSFHFTSLDEMNCAAEFARLSPSVG